MGVANRDIKLENVLLSGKKSPYTIKLTDFGFCKRDCDSLPKTICGTMGYMGVHPLLDPIFSRFLNVGRLCNMLFKDLCSAESWCLGQPCWAIQTAFGNPRMQSTWIWLEEDFVTGLGLLRCSEAFSQQVLGTR